MRKIRAGIVIHFIEFVLNTCQVWRNPSFSLVLSLLPSASSLSCLHLPPSLSSSSPSLPLFFTSLPPSLLHFPLSLSSSPPSLPPSLLHLPFLPPSLLHLPPFFTSLPPSSPSLSHLLPFLTFLPRDSWRLQESTAPPTLPHLSSFSQDWYTIWRDPPLATW